MRQEISDKLLEKVDSIILSDNGVNYSKAMETFESGMNELRSLVSKYIERDTRWKPIHACLNNSINVHELSEMWSMIVYFREKYRNDKTLTRKIEYLDQHTLYLMTLQFAVERATSFNNSLK